MIEALHGLDLVLLNIALRTRWEGSGMICFLNGVWDYVTNR